MWIEKILEAGERLRDWPVSGTVGYEFLNAVCGLFVDADAEPAFTALWESISGERHELRGRRRRGQARAGPGRSGPRSSGWPGRCGERRRRRRSRSLALRRVAAMPIYRTYVVPAEGWSPRPTGARSRRRACPTAVAQRLPLERPAPAEFVTRFQQTTPPVVAKGVEDTAFYRYARLVALNEVGGDPGRFGISVSSASTPACAERARALPARDADHRRPTTPSAAPTSGRGSPR